MYGWHRIAIIRENFGSVEDIKFAPTFCGLKIASAHNESMILIHDLDKSGKLSKRSASISFGKNMVSSITWNKNQLDPPMMAAGSYKKIGSIYEETMSIFAKEHEDWKEVYSFTSNERYPVPSSMLDISWALKHGRLFHYILGCSTKGIYLWKLNFDMVSPDNSEVPTVVKAVNILDFKFIQNNSAGACIRGAWNFMVS